MPEPQKPFDANPDRQTAAEAWLEAWAKMMNDVVSGEDFARWMNQYLAAYLEAAAPVRRQLEKAMQGLLRQWNVPTQSDLVDLAERLTNLERRVDDLDAKADRMLDLLGAIQSAVVPRAAPEPETATRRTAARNHRPAHRHDVRGPSKVPSQRRGSA